MAPVRLNSPLKSCNQRTYVTHRDILEDEVLDEARVAKEIAELVEVRVRRGKQLEAALELRVQRAVDVTEDLQQKV